MYTLGSHAACPHVDPIPGPHMACIYTWISCGMYTLILHAHMISCGRYSMTPAAMNVLKMFNKKADVDVPVEGEAVSVAVA